jgi:hypothetical protein
VVVIELSPTLLVDPGAFAGASWSVLHSPASALERSGALMQGLRLEVADLVVLRR